jgi:high-affinity iron transporter
MLINTVILLLRDGLPIVVLIVLLLHTTQSKQWIKITLGLSSLVIALLLFTVDALSQGFEGIGLELLSAASLVSLYIIIIMHLYTCLFKPNLRLIDYSAIAISTILVSSNGLQFMLYFTGFWAQNEVFNALVIGATLGLGICISIGILLYFLVRMSKPYYQAKIAYLLLLVFACGQLVHAMHLLAQIDFIPTMKILWDSNSLLKETSELGYFLRALMGYESRPTSMQLVVYLIALVLPLSYYAYKHKVCTPAKDIC